MSQASSSTMNTVRSNRIRRIDFKAFTRPLARSAHTAAQSDYRFPGFESASESFDPIGRSASKKPLPKRLKGQVPQPVKEHTIWQGLRSLRMELYSQRSGQRPIGPDSMELFEGCLRYVRDRKTEKPELKSVKYQYVLEDAQDADYMRVLLDSIRSTGRIPLEKVNRKPDTTFSGSPVSQVLSARRASIGSESNSVCSTPTADAMDVDYPEESIRKRDKKRKREDDLDDNDDEGSLTSSNSDAVMSTSAQMALVVADPITVYYEDGSLTTEYPSSNQSPSFSSSKNFAVGSGDDMAASAVELGSPLPWDLGGSEPALPISLQASTATTTMECDSVCSNSKSEVRDPSDASEFPLSNVDGSVRSLSGDCLLLQRSPSFPPVIPPSMQSFLQPSEQLQSSVLGTLLSPRRAHAVNFDDNGEFLARIDDKLLSSSTTVLHCDAEELFPCA